MLGIGNIRNDRLELAFATIRREHFLGREPWQIVQWPPGPLLPANDHLMQALSGVEAAQGGAGQPPTFLVWGAIDTASGWLSACAILAGLYARRRSGAGQSVSTSLLGTALMMKSGAFLSGGRAVVGPVLDGDQRGYGAAYRIYQGSDDGWFALATPDVTCPGGGS